MSLDDILHARVDPIIDKPSCQLLGPTALVVQALMGVLVILSLVYKRHRERPVRPWKIWLYDVSKQVVGQMFVHGLNVLISDVISRHTAGNACVFYFLNILIDTTLGVGLIYVIHNALTGLFSEKLRLKGFESGVYDDPPSFPYWIRQAAVYVTSLTTMKFLVLMLLILLPGLLKVGEWLLSWTQNGDGDALQVVFVMGIFPIVMNILQFWSIDSIVKAHHNNVMLDSTTDIQREPLFGVPGDDDDDDDNPHAPHDIENPRPRSRTQSLTEVDVSGDESDTLDILPADQKSIDTKSQADSHSYPPSLSGSLASTSTMPASPKPAKNLLKLASRRRNNTATANGTPTPTHSHQIYHPQPRIPQVASAAKSLEKEVRNPSIDSWGEWGETGDWPDEDRKDTVLDNWDATATLQANIR